MMGVICRLNKISGITFPSPVDDAMFKNGMITLPAAKLKNAAPMDDKYQIISVTDNAFPAFSLSETIAGVIKPKMINGTI